MSDYLAYLERKTQGGADSGFAPLWMPSFLFDFQAAIVDWAVRKGRAGAAVAVAKRGGRR